MPHIHANYLQVAGIENETLHPLQQRLSFIFSSLVYIKNSDMLAVSYDFNKKNI